MAAAAQAWVAVIGGLLTAVLALMTYFSARSRREKVTVVGKAFSSTVDGLSATEPAKQLAAAVLLRRFFDPHAEQGASGQPYQREAISVIAALLRTSDAGEFQKLLADGLAYAGSLAGADLQGCNLSRAYWGPRPRPPVTDGALRILSSRTWPFSRAGRAEASLADKCIVLTSADLSHAILSGASLRRAKATDAVFRRSTAVRTVFKEAKLQNANFKGATLQDADFSECDLTGAQFLNAQLKGARFDGARLGGACFAGAEDVPESVSSLLNATRAVPDVSEPPMSAAGARQN
jgi:uncharacterized protein YjbI with pentapeptide repeats